MWMHGSPRQGFCRRTAAMLANAASDAYSDDLKLISQAWPNSKLSMIEAEDSQALIVRNEGNIIIAFRGTEPSKIKDWLSDLDVRKAEIAWASGKYHVHRGFLDAYQAIREQAVEAARPSSRRDPLTGMHSGKLYITGHSLGGAIATLCAWDFERRGIEIERLYTFGSPRVLGWKAARSFSNEFNCRAFRVFYGNDIVPRVPSLVRFQHVGMPVFLKEFYGPGERADVINPGMLYLLFNRIKGFRVDMLRDHSMSNYVKALQ